MSHDIATQNPPHPQTAPLRRLAPEQGSSYVLQSLRDQAEAMGFAWELGKQLSQTQFAGPFQGKPEEMAVAILSGAALDIPSHQVGKSIYVVHGTPALYGKTALAIATNNGYEFERVTYEATKVTVRCTTPKGKTHDTTYTYQRAEREGLVKGNRTQYTLRPEKMLFWKCIGELADQVFPHLTNGMPIKEDWEQSNDLATITEPTDQDTALQAQNATQAITTLSADLNRSEAPQSGQQPTQARADAPQSGSMATTTQEPSITYGEDGYPQELTTDNPDMDTLFNNLLPTIRETTTHEALGDLDAIHGPNLDGIHLEAFWQALNTRLSHIQQPA